MKSEFTVEAREDLEKLDRRQLKAVRQKIEELEDDPTGHEDAKIIRVAGRDIYRIKVKENRGGEIDHRIIYDIQDGKITVYSVIHRDTGYNEEKISERLRE